MSAFRSRVRLTGQPRAQLIEFLSLILEDPAPLSSPVGLTRLPAPTERDLFAMADLFGGEIESVVHAILMMDDDVRPRSFPQVLPALIRHVNGADAIDGFAHDELLDDSFGHISAPADHLHYPNDHEALSSLLATTSVVGLLTQQQLDHMLTFAGGSDPLVAVLKSWHLVAEGDEEPAASGADAPEEKQTAPITVADLIERISAHPWPPAPAARAATRSFGLDALGQDEVFPLSSDITDEERELAQEMLLQLEVMNHATEPVVLTAEVRVSCARNSG